MAYSSVRGVWSVVTELFWNTAATPIAAIEVSYPVESPAGPHGSGMISPLELTGRHVVAIGDRVVGGCCR